MHRIMFLLLTLLLGACAAMAPQAEPPQANADFRHAIDSGPSPWTHEDFDNADDAFSFAIFSDLTGGEREGVFAVAIEQLRLLRPEFIVNVGDLVEGASRDREQLAAEWQSFEQRARRARAPIFYTGGNHDLGNPLQWELWEQRYGPRYYHFLYKDTLFLVLDTEDSPIERQLYIDKVRSEAIERIEREGWSVMPETAYGQLEERETGRIGPAQAEYFRQVIAANPQVRHTFLLMHKPAWERPGEENFAAIEAALAGRPYTVFRGHQHSYRHDRRYGRDYIGLGTTGGVMLESEGLVVDHVSLVTVSGLEVDIANLRLSGIFDKTGRIPAGGESLCFELSDCPPEH